MTEASAVARARFTSVVRAWWEKKAVRAGDVTMAANDEENNKAPVAAMDVEFVCSPPGSGMAVLACATHVFVVSCPLVYFGRAMHLTCMLRPEAAEVARRILQLRSRRGSGLAAAGAYTKTDGAHDAAGGDEDVACDGTTTAHVHAGCARGHGGAHDGGGSGYTGASASADGCSSDKATCRSLPTRFADEASSGERCDLPANPDAEGPAFHPVCPDAMMGNLSTLE